MTRLKELRLHGFKSFADPTRFVFEPGVNAVIGPNGSGKSNMADAVRWVLGEQSNRSLRTRRSDDVIFGGSDERRPQGMAEAILTLDNADGWLPLDFAEVSISRRAYRSGEAEYLINGARARLRDVVELLGEGRLGANELVVVGQGTVDAALSLRPEERRQLFEEAAGVKGLQVKRNESSGRLTRARDNLTRVSDLAAELKPQVRRLAMQAEHQQQHDTLGARARALVTASHRRRAGAARNVLGDARRRAAAAESELRAYREGQDAGRAAIAAAEERYWLAEEASRAAGEARREAREELIRLEGRMEAATARSTELASAIDAAQGDLETSLADLVALADGSPEAHLEPALIGAAAAERAWRAALAELASADDALLAAEQALSEVRASQSDLIASRARAGEEAARHRVRLEDAAAEHRAADAAVRALRSAVDGAREDDERAAGALAATLVALDARAGERDAVQELADAARHAVIEMSEALQAMRAELVALAEPHGAADRLGRRLSAAGWHTLLDAVAAPAESWPAIEAAVGGDLDSVLLWTEGQDPTAAIGDARGAARLLAAEPDPSSGTRAAALAAVDGDRTLAEWIGLPDMPGAFTRTVVAHDLGALLAGWRRLPAGWAAVTADGDACDDRGVLIRGRGDAPGGSGARAHARRRELETAVAELERRSADAQRSAHEASSSLRAARSAHLTAREAHDEAERAARLARQGRAAGDADLARGQERLERLSVELAALRASQPTGSVEIERAGDIAGLDAHEAAADAARARRDALALQRDETREAWTDARRAAEEVETRSAGLRGARTELEGRTAQLRAALADRRQTVASVGSELSMLADPLDAARARQAAADAAHGAAEEARAGLREELISLERDQGGGGARLDELERASQAAAMEASRRDEALAGLLREQEMALEGLPPLDAAAAADEVDPGEIEALDDARLDDELRRVRRTLAQIGSVNPFAVEEHRELAARLDEMTAQDTDLRAAISSTEELMARLDGEIATQFDAAFRAIGERFDEYCRLLFAGGSGSLQMHDEPDGDAPGGIEIVVRPPGKRLQRLAMLSGGERALTGVALLFAMLTVNPVPFCILDEVDAALDEANIGRFAQALRKLSESIDFVVITHNRATIEVADTIYGVTMTDAAVSRLLSLRLADLPAAVPA